jgi:hypothetical protein
MAHKATTLLNSQLTRFKSKATGALSKVELFEVQLANSTKAVFWTDGCTAGGGGGAAAKQDQKLSLAPHAPWLDFVVASHLDRLFGSRTVPVSVARSFNLRRVNHLSGYAWDINTSTAAAGSPFASCEQPLKQKRREGGGGATGGKGGAMKGGAAGELVLEGVLQEVVPRLQHTSTGECGSFCGVFSERRRSKGKGGDEKAKAGANPGAEAEPGSALALAWSQYSRWNDDRLEKDAELLAMTTPAAIADKAAASAAAAAAAAGGGSESIGSSALEDDGYHPDEGVCTRCKSADCKQAMEFEMASMTHFAFLNYLHGDSHYHHGEPPVGAHIPPYILRRTDSPR